VEIVSAYVFSLMRRPGRLRQYCVTAGPGRDRPEPRRSERPLVAPI
jgi:hypothetical protein